MQVKQFFYKYAAPPELNAGEAIFLVDNHTPSKRGLA